MERLENADGEHVRSNELNNIETFFGCSMQIMINFNRPDFGFN